MSDVWIETVGPVSAETSEFFSTYSYSVSPFGPHGPSEVRARFNLSAFVRAEIQKALANPSQT